MLERIDKAGLLLYNFSALSEYLCLTLKAHLPLWSVSETAVRRSALLTQGFPDFDVEHLFYNWVKPHKGIDGLTPGEKLIIYFYPEKL